MSSTRGVSQSEEKEGVVVINHLATFIPLRESYASIT